MVGDSELNLPHLVLALDEVARWRQNQEDTAKARLRDIAGESQRLKDDIGDLQRQLDVLRDLSEQVDSELSGLPILETRRTRAAVHAGIQAEAQVVAQRNSALDAALQQRQDSLALLLAQPDVAKLVEEFEQFQALETTLSKLPEGYRKAMLAHNESVRERLRPVQEAADAPLELQGADPAAVTLVVSITPEEGPPEALAVLLPVPFAAHSAWSDRPEDLSSLLAFRVVAAIGSTLAAVGAPDAPVQFADYRGHLAIQVWLGDEDVQGDIKEAFGAQVDRMRDDATELAAVSLELYTAWLDPAVVNADVDESEGAADEAAAGEGERTIDEGYRNHDGDREDTLDDVEDADSVDSADGADSADSADGADSADSADDIELGASMMDDEDEDADLSGRSEVEA